MRVRLLVDTVIEEDELQALAETIAEQPAITMQMPAPLGLMGGRFMGAQALNVETAEA